MDENKELTAYEQDVIAVLDEIKQLFLMKNRSYNGESPFSNFIVGGLLLHGDAGYFGRFEALKSYVTKHIANLYTHNIGAPGLDESIRDIATYMIIAIVMKRQNDQLAAEEQKRHFNDIPLPKPEEGEADAN